MTFYTLFFFLNIPNNQTFCNIEYASLKSTWKALLSPNRTAVLVRPIILNGSSNNKSN